jgi:hypothetical protein
MSRLISHRKSVFWERAVRKVLTRYVIYQMDVNSFQLCTALLPSG